MPESRIRKVCCPNCGAVSNVYENSIAEDANWLSCELPTGFEWRLPAGKISPVVGPDIYVSSIGEHLSRENFILKYGIDPKIAYERMRGKA